MKCLNCGKEFIVKRTLKTLFVLKNEVVCDECLKKYKLKMGFSSIPLNKHVLEVISLFDTIKFKYQIYEELLDSLYKKAKKNYKDYYVLKEDILKLTEGYLSELEDLAKAKNKNIMILTFNLQMD